MGTRKECRKAIVALFSTTNFTGGVYDYLPVNLNGATKVLAVYNDNTSHQILSKENAYNFYTFNLDVLVKRAGATSEDDLDDLHELVRSTIRAAIPNAAWNEITIEDDSEFFFAEISGIAYRVEQHRVKNKVRN